VPSITYTKRKAKKHYDKYANMRAAKKRKREEYAKTAGQWTPHEYLLRFTVSPDGRHVALAVGDTWRICGSERMVRSVLAKAIWKRTTKDNRKE
jgi:hypothetical protein